MTGLGMGIASYAAGRLSDRFGPRPFTVLGFSVLVLTSVPMAFVTAHTSLWIVIVLLFAIGLAMGLWNVPNNSTILGAVPRSRLGVVGALTNLTRNVGNVTGQALASAIVVGVMVSRGFDIPLSDVGDDPGAGSAFTDGWQAAYFVVTALSLVGLGLAMLTKPRSSTLRSDAEMRSPPRPD